MAITRYGRYVTGPETYFGFIASGQQRATVYNKTTKHLWAYQIGGWIGKYTGNAPTVRFAIYATDASKNPTSRIAYSDSFSATTTMADATGGASYEKNIAQADIGPSTDAVPLTSGTRYAISMLGTSYQTGHSMQAAAFITKDNEKFYNRTGLSQPPPDPFGSYSSSPEGHQSLWVVCDDNEAPETPTNLSPSGNITDTAPTFSADFDDFNAGDAGGTDRGDYLNQYKIQVRRASDETSFWNTTVSASGAEQTAKAISKAYGGTTLVRGTEYEWRCQMSDYFGAWSDWTAWTSFTPVSLGYVTLDGSPTGKIEEVAPDFEGRWNHQSPEDMDIVQVRILASDNTTVLQTGDEYDIADVSSSALPGTLFTVSWANSGLSALAWGTSYYYQIRGKDTPGALWSNWSDSRAFNTNAAPSIPTNLTPDDGAIETALPLLKMQATDADDTTGTGFVAKARIKDDASVVLDTVSMTYDSALFGGDGGWKYQITGAETGWASYDDYRWDAYTGDGTLWSGEVTSEGSATKSAEASFTYALGPVISSVSPADGATITTSNISVTWTVTDQQKYRVYLYTDGTTTAVYDSGEIVSTTSTHTIPSGYIVDNTSYDLQIWVEDSNPLEGWSSIINLTVDYVEPDDVTNFTADPVSVTIDPWESAIRLSWDQTTYGTDEWQQYIIHRSASGGPDASEIILARITSPTQTDYTDYLPASGYEYTYTITQQILTGLDYLVSGNVTDVATVTLGGVVLCQTTDPEGVRAALRYTAERPHGGVDDQAVYQPLDGSKPTTVRSRTNYWALGLDGQMHTNNDSTAAEQRSQLEAVDVNRGTLCYRDEKGRKYFCVLADKPTISDQVPNWYTFGVNLREQTYTEGVT